MALHQGDFTALARDYADHRAAYAPGIAAALLGMAAAGTGKAVRELDVVDAGAGTGIWTRMLAPRARAVTAVEPNARMLALGREASAGLAIDWRVGTAEQTGLESGSCDLATIASALHWTDFDASTAELRRVLRPGGVFAALWNTRDIAGDPLLLEIEAELERRVPRLERISSGRSAFCESLAERLAACGRFADVVYLEGRHVERMTPARYLGLWCSVNAARAQAGEDAFGAFLEYVAERTRALERIDATYVTRTWAASVAR